MGPSRKLRMLLEEGEVDMEGNGRHFIIHKNLVKNKNKHYYHGINSGLLQAKKMFFPTFRAHMPSQSQIAPRCWLPGFTGDWLLALGSWVLSGLNIHLTHGVSSQGALEVVCSKCSGEQTKAQRGEGITRIRTRIRARCPGPI